jgi:hypothetical protein
MALSRALAFKWTYIDRGWWKIPVLLDTNRHLKYPCIFFVTVRHGPHKDLGTWAAFYETIVFDDFSFSRIPHSVQSAGLLNV